MKAQKANKVITIPVDQKEQYLQQGYMILDDDYNIIDKPAGESADLKSQIQALKAQIAEKDAEIQTLKDQIVALTPKPAEAAEDKPAEAKKDASKK